MSSTKLSIILFVLLLLDFTILITQPQKEITLNSSLNKTNSAFSRSENTNLESFIKKKEKVNKLVKEKSINKVYKLFEQDFASIDKLCNRNNYLEALKELVELEYIYNQPIYKQEILLKKVEIFNKLALFSQMYKGLQAYIDMFIHSPRLEEVKYNLQLAQFYLNKYDEIIALESDYTGKRDDRYKFILAYSYINTGKYEKANQLIERINLPKYNFFAKVIKANYFCNNNNTTESLKILHEIIDFEENPDRLKLSYLLLARFYLHVTDYEKAINNYKVFIQDTEINSIKDDVLYEMGWCYLNNEDYINAGKVFKEIIVNRSKSEYYDEVRFLFQNILSRLSTIAETMQLLAEKVNKNDSIYNDSIYDALEKREGLREQVIMDIFLPESLQVFEISSKLFDNESSKLITRLYEDNTPLPEFHEEDALYKKKIKLSILESELLSHVILLELIDKIERIYKIIDIKEYDIKKNVIDDRITYTDSLLQEMKFDLEVNIILSQLLYFNKKDIEFVKNIISEKLKIKKLKNNIIRLLNKNQIKNSNKFTNRIKKASNMIDSLFTQIDLIIDNYINNRRDQDSIFKNQFMQEKRLTTDLSDKILKEKKKLSLILEDSMKKSNVKIEKDFTELNASLEKIKKDLQKELSTAISKNYDELIIEIRKSITNIDNLIIKVNNIYEKYAFRKHKPDYELKQLLIAESDTITILKEKVRNAREMITLEFENRIEKNIKNKKLMDSNNNFTNLKKTFADTLKQKVKLLPPDLKELFFQEMDLVNYKDNVFRESILSNLILHENLIKKLNKHFDM